MSACALTLDYKASLKYPTGAPPPLFLNSYTPHAHFGKRFARYCVSGFAFVTVDGAKFYGQNISR